METKDFNLLGIIALVGAIIMIVGVFLNWLTLDLGFLGKATYNGMDIFNDSDLDYKFVPIVSLICGIIAICLMILPTFMNNEKFEKINNILGIVTLILSAVVVICGILFYTQSSNGISLTDIYDINIGFWLVLVGAIITLIGGLAPIIKNKFM